MTPPLSEREFALLRSINTPTLANAIELLGFRDRMEGFTRGNIRPFFPELGAVLGYAVTVTIRSAQKTDSSVSLKEYWDHIEKIPGPRLVVVQDLDEPSGGAWWGEVNSNIHMALGCTGVITNGSVRDLDEVRPLGFHFFGSSVAVSHGYAFPNGFNQEVCVDGMTVNPGELVHADRHGAITFPIEKVRDVLAAVAAVERYERPMIQLCKSAKFSSSALKELLERGSNIREV
jgi:4-hydroxy-4-methyl-2-oxoglutarate aldolase